MTLPQTLPDALAMIGSLIRDPNPIVARAARRVRIDESSGCWVWQGWTHKGYGMLQVGTAPNRRTVAAHRVLWEAVHGPMPEGKESGHRCPAGPRKNCVSPFHIEAITTYENRHDRYTGLCAKGLHSMTDPANRRQVGRNATCRTCNDEYERRRVPRRRHRVSA